MSDPSPDSTSPLVVVTAQPLPPPPPLDDSQFIGLLKLAVQEIRRVVYCCVTAVRDLMTHSTRADSMMSSADKKEVLQLIRLLSKYFGDTRTTMQILKALIERDRDITASIDSVTDLIKDNDALTTKIEDFESREMKEESNPTYLNAFADIFQFAVSHAIGVDIATVKTGSSVPLAAVNAYRRHVFDSIKTLLGRVRDRLMKIRDKKSALCKRVKSDHDDRMCDDKTLIPGRVSSPKSAVKTDVLSDIDIVIELCDAGFDYTVRDDTSLDARLDRIKAKHNLRDEDEQKTTLDNTNGDVDNAMAIVV